MRKLSLFLAIFCLSFMVMAQVPSTINFQGNLTELGNNTPIEGELAIIFELFDSNTDGSSIWSETQNPVMIINGIFNVKLGAVNPLPANAFSQALWLQITVDTETLDQRIELSSAPYSQAAKSVIGDNFVPNSGNVYIGGGLDVGGTFPAIDLAIDDDDTGLEVPADGNLSFYTNGEERMLLNIERLSVQGNIAATDTVKANVFATNAPRIDYYSISAADFVLAFPTDQPEIPRKADVPWVFQGEFNVNDPDAGLGTSTFWAHTLKLPDGAIIQQVDGYFEDGDATYGISMNGWKHFYGRTSGQETFMAGLTTTSIGDETLTNTDIGEEIDNDTYIYYIVLTVPANVSAVTVFDVKVTYSY